MFTAEERMLWFLSDPSLSERDFEKLAGLLSEDRCQDLIREAQEVRKAVRKRDWADVRRKLHKESKETRHDDPLLDRVSRLLLVEANMTTRTALKALYETLGTDQQLPGNNSLQLGIKRLTERFQPSEILSVAQRVRNQVVHHSPDEPNIVWPLKRNTK